MRFQRLLVGATVPVLGVSGLMGLSLATPAGAAGPTTAWRAGTFNVNTANLVRQANIFLGKPNTTAGQSMALGNGKLGAAVWAANGFTAQLNRVDTLPGRKSPGWVTIPGLATITSAPDFTGYVDPYDGVLHESGGGMTATVYVRTDKDQLVVDVTGANPGVAQTAAVNLWAGRTPTAGATGAIGTLAETWVDNIPTTGSGRTFGSLAAITAGGRNVTASVLNSTGVQVSFTPNTDGSFRVIVGSPTWAGGNAGATAAALLGADAGASSAAVQGATLNWWHGYWSQVGPMKLWSADGTAQYMQTLRTLYYFYAAAERGGEYPASQAGMADLFNYSQDYVQWYSAAYWFWNLRGQVAANIGGGPADLLNSSLYNLYTSNLANLQAWTQAKMGGRAGICVPETMRFNGNGYQNDSNPNGASSCNQLIGRTWNGSTISTGAEIGLWVWRQYQSTLDKNFLTTNYPLMREAAKFLLAYATPGTDGLLHSTANAHENQWFVKDPINTIAAMGALFPATIAAAQTLNVDPTLVSQLQAARTKLPPFPRTDAATHKELRTAADDANTTTVLGQSSEPTAAIHNNENDDLEPVWPYNLISDTSSLFPIAQRTYTNRVTGTTSNDWSFDAVDAARLGLGSQVAADMVALTKNYQPYINGLGSWHGGVKQNSYIEQSANIALALNESLVQYSDGIVRIAPATPPGWDVDGTLWLPGKSSVSVQIHGGAVTTVGIKAGSTGTITVRNPWPGKSVNVVDGADETTVVVAATTAKQFTIPAVSGHSYLVQQVAVPVSGMGVAGVNDVPATSARHLAGVVQVGLDVPTGTRIGKIRGYAGLCADDSGAKSITGNPILAYQCTSAVNQIWTSFTNGELQTMNGCMTVGTGNAVQWAVCGGAPTQLWKAQPNGTVLNSGSGLCLADPNNGVSGTHLVVATCTAAANQIWTLP